MADATRESVLPLDLAGLTLVSETSRADSKVIPAFPAKTSRGAFGAGLILTETPIGSQIEARTTNNTYRLVLIWKNVVEISGHPEYCPQPVFVPLCGTRWLDQSSKRSFLVPGMSLQFTDKAGRSVTTSRILSVQVVS